MYRRRQHNQINKANRTRPTKDPTATPAIAPVVHKMLLEALYDVLVIGGDEYPGYGDEVVEAILEKYVLVP